LHVVGQAGIGCQIFKCPTCGNMDRRLPAERRVIPDDLGRPSRASSNVVLALELLAVLAIAAAAAIALRP
jgi:hypothetical protein